MTKYIVKENVAEESFILPDGTKKIIKYGIANWTAPVGSKATVFDTDGNILHEGLSQEELSKLYDELYAEIDNIGAIIWGDPNNIPTDAHFSKWGGKLTAEHMKITYFDKNENIIKEEIKVNEYQDWEKYSSTIDDYHKKYPNTI
jgi:hypothetical protein